METLELLIVLLAAVAVVVRLAGHTPIPEPVLLLLAGLAVAVIPGLPEVELDPELTLALFLPPLLYWAALHTDLRQLRANLRPIGLLAVGLVLVTTAAVALLAHSVLGMPWAVAVVLGAIVSPPDPVAATAAPSRSARPGSSWPSRPSGGRRSGWPSAGSAAASCAACPRRRSRTPSSCCCHTWPG